MYSISKLLKMMLVYILLIILVLQASSDQENYVPLEERCVFKGCHPIDENKINVHLIPHSHDEVGWLKTVDEYYQGLKNDIQNVGVKYILTSVMETLLEDPNKRYSATGCPNSPGFIQVETAYFWRWWQDQTDEQRRKYRMLVQRGQIEMVGGGWVINDEACTNYQSIIDQFTWGLRIINDHLGECARPKIGWQIDTAMHSSEQSSIFQQMGYDAYFNVYNDSTWETLTKLFWKMDHIIGADKIYSFYYSKDSFYPKGFCLDYFQCRDSLIDDDPNSSDYNLPKKVKEFDEHIEQNKCLCDNHVMVPIGGAFQYQEANINFKYMDKLLNAYKDHKMYNVFYSTPSCFFKAVYNNGSHEILRSQYFPLINSKENVIAGTGYFTSRPTIKRFERTGNNILQAVKQLNAHAQMKKLFSYDSYEENIRSLREAMATIQHHNAITGTNKQAVADDYVRMLTEAIKESEIPIGSIIGNILKKDVNANISLPISLCLLKNMTVCENTIQDKYIVVLYNPLSKDLVHYVRLPAQKATYKITDLNGNVEYDLVLPMQYHVKTPLKSAEAEIIFAVKIVRMGIAVIYVEKLDKTDLTYRRLGKHDSRTFGDNMVNFTLDENNLLEKVSMHDNTLNISQQFMFYESGIQSSPYVFRAADPGSAFNVNYNSEKKINENSAKPSVTYFRGKLVDEIVQKYNDWASQTIRVYKDQNIEPHIEFDWMIGPLEPGREIISRFFVKNFTNDHFYTDSNGRKMIRRKRKGEQVGSNYYPVTSKIQIKDEKKHLQVSVLTDRSQGGSSLWNGEIELMLHRRLRDEYNVGVLEEMEFDNYLVVRGQHYLTLGNYRNKDVTINDKMLELKKLLQPLVLVGNATSPDWSLENTQKKLNFKWSALSSDPFPNRIHILSLEPWKYNSYLMRFENLFSANEYIDESAELGIHFMFQAARVRSMRLTNLAANEWLSEPFYYWSDMVITLEPTRIVTVVFEF